MEWAGGSDEVTFQYYYSPSYFLQLLLCLTIVVPESKVRLALDIPARQVPRRHAVVVTHAPPTVPWGSYTLPVPRTLPVAFHDARLHVWCLYTIGVAHMNRFRQTRGAHLQESAAG